MIRYGSYNIMNRNRAFMRYFFWEVFRSLRFLQGLELIDPLLGVAHTDLTQGLVLVPAGSDVLGVEHIVVGLLVVVSGFCQLWAQGLWRDDGEYVCSWNLRRNKAHFIKTQCIWCGDLKPVPIQAYTLTINFCLMLTVSWDPELTISFFCRRSFFSASVSRSSSWRWSLMPCVCSSAL